MCSLRLCESIVANPIIYRLIPRPSRFEFRQWGHRASHSFNKVWNKWLTSRLGHARTAWLKKCSRNDPSGFHLFMSPLKNYFLQIRICHQQLHNRTWVFSTSHEIAIISYLLRFLPSTTFSSFIRQKKCHVMFLFRPSASLLSHLQKPSINSFRIECEPRHRSCNASIAFDLYPLPVIGVRAPLDLGGWWSYCPKKITQCPKECVVQTHSNLSKTKTLPIRTSNERLIIPKLQLNPNFSNLRGKRKLVRKVGYFEKSGVRRGKRLLFRVIRWFEKMRVHEVGIQL